MPDYVKKFDLGGTDIYIKDETARNSIADIPHNLYSKAEKGKNIVFIGDSWTVGSGADDPDTEKFSTVLCESLGMNEINLGVSGSGFARPTPFQDQADAAILLPVADRRNTNIIMIVGGMNDLRHTDDETFAQASAGISGLISTLVPYFPNAVICFAINTIPYETTATMRDWIERMKQYITARTKAHAILFDTFTQIFISNVNLFAPGLINPTTYGHARIAGYLKNALLGGVYANPLRDTDEITWTRTGYSTGSGGHIYTDGKFVYVEQTRIDMASETGSHICGSVPSGLIPARNVYFPIYHTTDGIIGTGVINSSGGVYINQTTAHDSAYIGSLMYLCAK
ncbi:SGNH/GDSL hydrolase family protein [Ruminococcus sp.]|uniref:SGNH/GDSL hydrolase family protein n=1 Tax=Ruminococcus sp. TaxID=41978 RepID=UPI001B567446|nr:SGNH/GDSL hydrolase family protein [Ruminococcus sp.]MBP5433246.1 SGNH/GDSL hydrolase family protein [Ruminococcus sp.]